MTITLTRQADGEFVLGTGKDDTGTFSAITGRVQKAMKVSESQLGKAPQLVDQGRLARTITRYSSP